MFSHKVFQPQSKHVEEGALPRGHQIYSLIYIPAGQQPWKYMQSCNETVYMKHIHVSE